MAEAKLDEIRAALEHVRQAPVSGQGEFVDPEEEPTAEFDEPYTFAEADQPAWKTVHRIAERYEREIALHIVEAFERLRPSINEEALALELTQHGQTGQIDWEVLAQRLSDALRGPMAAIAKETALELLPGFRARQEAEAPITFADPIDTSYESMSLVLRHTAAEDYLRGNLPRLITNVTTETQEAVRDVILNGFQNGVPPRDMARSIRTMVGMTGPQAATYNRLRSNLLAAYPPGKARTEAQLAKVQGQLERYSTKAIRYRALNIARTETLRAANAGQQALWTSATNEGLLQRDVTKREWIATPSERTCPSCMALDGVKVGMNEAWHSDRGDVTMPPLHPQCRCAMGIAIVEEAAEKPSLEYKDLTELEDVALENYRYTGNVNSFLRADPTYTSRTVEGIDSVFAKARPASGDRTLYRGVSPEFAAELRAKIGQEFVEQGYLSTAKRREHSFVDAGGTGKGVVLRVEVPKGTPYLDMDALRRVYYETGEMLLPRGSRFTIAEENGELVLRLLQPVAKPAIPGLEPTGKDFDGLPQVLTEAELDAVIAGGEKEFYRGIGGPGTGQTALDYARMWTEEFRRGEHYVGRGVWGNGTYIATSGVGETATPLTVARQFAGKGIPPDDGRGFVVRGSIKADARIIGYEELEKEWLAAIGKEQGWEPPQMILTMEQNGRNYLMGGTRPRYSNYESMPEELRDPGAFARSRGYDAIFVPSSNIASYMFGDQYVVLNRSALRVQDTDL